MHNDIPYFETSAKDDNCVEDVFLSIAEQFLIKLDDDRKESFEDMDNMDMADNSSTVKSSMFCCWKVFQN